MVAELDSSPEVLDRIAQEVLLEADTEYCLLFDLRGTNAAGSSAESTNELRVIWDGSAVGTYRGVDFWQTFAVPLTGSGERAQLEFREIAGDGNDGSGPLLDNVRLVQIGTSMIQNGGFDSVDTAGTVEAAQVEGWTAMGAPANRLLEFRVDDQRRFINLDTSENNLDRIYQDLATDANVQYLVSFDLQAAGGTSALSEELRVRWNDSWVGTFRGDANWQRFSLVVEATSDESRLVLREPPNGTTQAGDGSGPLVDNVTVTPIQSFVGLDIAANQDQLIAYPENASPVVLAPQLVVEDSLGSSSVSRAVVQVTQNEDNNTGRLDADVQGSSIEKTFVPATGLLTLTGNASAAEYENVLRTVTYFSTSENPSAKPTTISFRVESSDSRVSRTTTVNVVMSSENDAPMVANQADGRAAVDTQFVRAVQASDAEDSIDLLTFELTFAGDAVQSGDRIPEIDADGVISWIPSRVGSLTMNVTVTDQDGATGTASFQVDVAESLFIETGTVETLSGSHLPVFTIPDSAVGTSLASFRAQTNLGDTIQFEADGTARIFGFFAHWCPHCQAELPMITEWLGQDPLPDGVEFVGVSIAVNEAADNYPPSDWFEREQFPGPVIVDDASASLQSIFGVSGYPFWVAVDGSGVVQERAVGPITENQLNNFVSNLSS